MRQYRRIDNLRSPIRLFSLEAGDMWLAVLTGIGYGWLFSAAIAASLYLWSQL